MKRNPQFIMRTVVDKQVIVPVGQAAANFHGMLTVNSTGACIWEMLEKECTEESLVAGILEQYDVAQEIAALDVKNFLQKLRKVGALTE